MSAQTVAVVELSRRAVAELPEPLRSSTHQEGFDRWVSRRGGVLGDTRIFHDPHEVLYLGLTLASGIALETLNQTAAAALVGVIRRIFRKPSGDTVPPFTPAQLRRGHRRIVRGLRRRGYPPRQALLIADAVVAVLSTDSDECEADRDV